MQCTPAIFDDRVTTASNGSFPFVQAGGEDDLLSVYHVVRGRVWACGKGHTSWVRGPLLAIPSFIVGNMLLIRSPFVHGQISRVAFDPAQSQGKAHVRVISTGHDGQVVLWDVPAGSHKAQVSPGNDGFGCNCGVVFVLMIVCLRLSTRRMVRRRRGRQLQRRRCPP